MANQNHVIRVRLVIQLIRVSMSSPKDDSYAGCYQSKGYRDHGGNEGRADGEEARFVHGLGLMVELSEELGMPAGYC